MIKLKQLSIKNFKSFGKKQTVNLSNLGLTLLVGSNQDSFQSNGAGKSSFLDAIVYALYGSTSDGSKGNSIINRKVGKNMEVTLSFSSGKNNYVVKRYRKDSKYKNKSFLYLNGHNVTKRSIKKTNEALEHILGMNKDTYLHSYMFNGTGAKFASLTDREKKKVLDDVIKVSIYPIAHDVSKNDAKLTKNKLSTVSSKIDSTGYALKSLKGLQKDTYSAMKEHKNHLYEVKNKLVLAKQKCLSLGETSQNHSASYYHKKIKTYKSQLDLVQSQLDNIKEQQSEVEANKQSALVSGNKMKTAGWKLGRLTKKYAEYKKRLASLASGSQKSCYWCGQPLNDKSLGKEINNIVQAISDTKASIISQTKSISSLRSDYRSALKVYTTGKNHLPDIAKLTNSVSKYNEKINDCHNSLSKIKNQLDNLSSLQKEFDELEKQQTYQNYDKKIDDTTKKLKSQSNTMKLLKKKYKLYKEAEEVYSNHGVKSMLLDLILPFINKQANHYLQVLTNGSISLEIVPTTTSASTGNTSEKINMKITNNHGADNYKGLSSGEQKRVDISILLALQDYVLSKASTRMNVVSFDEVFDALDESGTRSVVRLLAERAKKFPNILVVSHNDELKQAFPNYLVIQKKNGISTIK